MIASTVSNNNKLARPLPQVLADAAAAAVKAAAAAAKSDQVCDAAPSSSSSAASREVQQMENDRRRKIAAKCLELEEMLESKGYKLKYPQKREYLMHSVFVLFSKCSHSPSEIETKVSDFRSLLMRQSNLQPIGALAASNPLASRLFAAANASPKING